MDWLGWATFGVGSTVLLTAIMIAAQLVGWTRIDLPLILGTVVTIDVDRARVAGFVLHLGMGQVFALFYAAAFTSLGWSAWWLGAIFGLFHGVVALTVVLRLLPGVHPRMATERSGPQVAARLEPPGLLALNYGGQTPALVALAHIAYGASLGLFLSP